MVEKVDILMDNKYEFILVLIRISVIFTFGIFFGDKRISKLVKAAFIFLVTMVVLPTVDMNIDGNMSDFQFMINVCSEIIIGLTIGLISALIINTIQMAGSIIDVQGGFGMAQVFDPTTQSQVSIVSQFLITFGLLFFVLNNFHVTFLEMVIDSFKLIPVGMATSINFSDMFMVAIKSFTVAISIGICMALPVIGVIFMVDAILGIATRTMPQLNLFSVGYIVKIFNTLILLYVYSVSINYFVGIITKTVFNFIERLV